jgi:predicted dehydrogenase
MSDPRVCIIGAGSLSTRRIYPYIGAAGGQLVGVCDLDPEKARQNTARFGGRAYGDLVAMLNEQKPDGVMICVGPRGHGQLARTVLRMGYPVYTEKPPAMGAADALETARLARQTGLLCTTAFKKRYNVAYTRAKKWVDSFPPENLYSISVDYCSKQYSNATPERSFLFDFAIHAIDLVGYLFGDVAQVFAFSKGPDAYAVSLRFANGAVGSMNLADGRSFNIPTEEVELTAAGGNFMTIHNSSIYRITANETPAEWREPPTFTSAGDSGNDTGHLAEIVDFFAALQEKRIFSRSSIYESYKSMVLYEAIAQSAAEGKVVDLRYESL